MSAARGFDAPQLILLIGALICAIQGTGWVNYIQFDGEGFEYRNFLTSRRYRWDEVEGFQLRVIRASLFTTVKTIVFSRRNQTGTMYGKFSKAVAGGTECMPVVGDHAQVMRIIEILRTDAVGRLADDEKETAGDLPAPEHSLFRSNDPSQHFQLPL